MSQEEDISLASLEFDRVEHITYDNAYVAFIDILGFRETVLGNDLERVSLYYSIIKNVVHKKLEPPLEFGGRFNIQVMSDSIVISVTPNDNSISNHIKSFRALSVGVGALQLDLAINNFWARGGITFGPIAFLEKNFVVGPALVNSYLLENERAKVPRIIIDPLIPEILKMDEEQFINVITHNKDLATFHPWILKKDSIPGSELNDYTYIHYLYFFEQDWKFVLQAAEKISRHLKEHLAVKNQHIEKYLWVAKYIKSLELPDKVKACFKWLDTIELTSMPETGARK